MDDVLHLDATPIEIPVVSMFIDIFNNFYGLSLGRVVEFTMNFILDQCYL